MTFKSPIHNGIWTSLKEVFTATTPPLRHRSAVIWNSAENLEARLEIFFQVHDGCDIAATVAVVRSRPYGDNIFVFEVVLLDVSVAECPFLSHALPCNPH
jgi:hypothetical protein